MDPGMDSVPQLAAVLKRNLHSAGVAEFPAFLRESKA